MISSIFGKTKPINYIIVFSFLFVFYWFVHFFIFDNPYSVAYIGFQTIILGVLFFSIFIVDFIVKKNNLADDNSFSMLFYAMLIVLFHETLMDVDAIFCSLFLLFAIRKLFSIRSLKNIKFKIFDATLWVMISSLFNEWAVLYLVLVFATIYIYEPNNIRNWLVPFAATFTVFMISYTILILANNSGYLFKHYQFSLQFNTAYFLEWGSSIRRIFYLILTLFTIAFSFFKLGKVGTGRTFTMRLLALSFFIGIVVDLFSVSNSVHPILITFFPAVVFLTNYVEVIKKPKIKEIVLILSIFIPLMVFISNMVRR